MPYQLIIFIQLTIGITYLYQQLFLTFLKISRFVDAPGVFFLLFDNGKFCSVIDYEPYIYDIVGHSRSEVLHVTEAPGIRFIL